MTLQEQLFFNLRNSVLLGNLKNARMWLHFLREDFKKDESLFESLKRSIFWEELKILGEQVDNGEVVRKYELLKELDDSVHLEGDNEKFRREKALVDKICKDGQESLRKLFKASNKFYLSSREYPTLFGRLDLLGKDERTIYAIEVKKGTAKHDIVSQIDKYILDLKLKLMYRTYDIIKGAVIANGFSQYALNELRKNNIIILKYKYNIEEDILKLSKVRRNEAGLREID